MRTEPCKADIVAADRLLKAAVREARQRIADEGQIVSCATYKGHEWTWLSYDRDAVVQLLEAAGVGAALLLGEAVA